MRRLLCWSAIASVFMVCSETKAQTLYPPIQIAFAKAESFGGFDVAYDEKKDIIHLVYRNLHTVYYISSTDKGKKWSEPFKIAERALCPNLKLGADGILHLVFTKHKGENDDANGILYTYLKNGAWSPVDTVFDRSEYDEALPRIAIDQSNTVHLLAWSYDWPIVMDNECLVYFRKEKNQAAFSKPELWCREAASNKIKTGHAAITADSKGNIHIVNGYFNPAATNNDSIWQLQYRKLNKNRKWDEPRNFSQMSGNNFQLGDNCFDIAVDNNGKVYISSFSSWGHWDTGKHGITVWSLMPGADTLMQEMFVQEYWEINSRMLVLPNNDILLATGNNGWADGDTKEQYKASIFYYNARDKSWGNRLHVSDNPIVRNLLSKADMSPKWLQMGKDVFIVYAEENQPNTGFKYYMRKMKLPN